MGRFLTLARGYVQRRDQHEGPASRSVGSPTKSIEGSVAETEEPEHQLRRELSALSLTAWGIGVIGTGIFVLTAVLVVGIRASARINLVIVCVKLAVVRS